MSTWYNPFSWGGNQTMTSEGFSSGNQGNKPVDAITDDATLESGLLGNFGELDEDGNSKVKDFTEIEAKLKKTTPEEFEALAPDKPELNTAVAESTDTQGVIGDAVSGGEGGLLDVATDDFFNENEYGESPAEERQRFEDNMETYGTNDLDKIREYNETVAKDKWFNGSRGDVDAHSAKGGPATRKDLRKENWGKALGAFSDAGGDSSGLLQNEAFQYNLIG